ncbi:7-carboxy-7-deazaguanine synthase QueE [Geofilum rubicundum]|uniref:7-carboxy-7-deazaguanine synthase n=1 Tax=Geofilum rubicundum JCM 15548 TaxID=1236989 RepID=A0A0E9M2R6_9BACT|nr:7-carboxy-7-deazaguanine synthase QueE [Geofilum rubicundum]GAO31410.1 queuosine biosynthesis QueE radical SAM protein [Geofilum rubicundum JCM 15548]
MNQKISLANEGVFPIVKDKEGQVLPKAPATGITVAGTIQGEGKLAGIPSLFIRFSSCNLRCIWQLPDGTYSRCDTPYASFDANGIQQITVDDVLALVKHNLGPIRHIVITGGEPLLQKDALIELAARLKSELQLHLTIETNGSIFNAQVAQQIDLFSISPKLANSTPNPAKLAALGLSPSGPLKFHGERRLNLSALQAYIDVCRSADKAFQLKFVVGQAADEQEITSAYLNRLTGWAVSDIMLMPLGATQEELQQTTPMVLEMAIRNGWRFTPRVHIDLFGSKPGV